VAILPPFGTRTSIRFLVRFDTVAHVWARRKQVARNEVVVVVGDAEPDPSAQEMYGDGPFGLMLGDYAPGAEDDQGHPKRPVLEHRRHIKRRCAGSPAENRHLHNGR
jgi:hypothetical protein